MNSIKIKNVEIGTKKPKIALSIVSSKYIDIIEEAKSFRDVNVDIVEWRCDYFEDVSDYDKVEMVLNDLKGILENTLILFTFRTLKEGGNKDISKQKYKKLLKFVVSTKLVDLIDVEMFTGDDLVKDIIKFSNDNGVYVICSNHDFLETPPKEEIISRLIKMQDLGANISKIALMPNDMLDVLELLKATVIMNEKYKEALIVTISMGNEGMCTRFLAEIFGSCITFASLNNSSAPGQMNVKDLEKILNIINKSK